MVLFFLYLTVSLTGDIHLSLVHRFWNIQHAAVSRYCSCVKRSQQLMFLSGENLIKRLRVKLVLLKLPMWSIAAAVILTFWQQKMYRHQCSGNKKRVSGHAPIFHLLTGHLLTDICWLDICWLGLDICWLRHLLILATPAICWLWKDICWFRHLLIQTIADSVRLVVSTFLRKIMKTQDEKTTKTQEIKTKNQELKTKTSRIFPIKTQNTGKFLP